VKWLEKDMELMLESAAELNVPVPLTSLSRQLYRAAIAKGLWGSGCLRIDPTARRNCRVRGWFLLESRSLTRRSCL
jgi:hypothetical protein